LQSAFGEDAAELAEPSAFLVLGRCPG